MTASINDSPVGNRRGHLLAVSGVAPWPIRGGLSLRAAHLVRELALEWDITLIAPTGSVDGCPVQLPVGIDLVPVRLDPRWPPVPHAGGEDRRRLHSAANQVLSGRRPDVALLWPGTEFLALTRPDFPPSVADRIDCATLERLRAARRSPGTLARAVRCALYERRIVRELKTTVAVGRDDARALERLGRTDNVVVIRNGVAPQPGPRFEAEHPLPTVTFTGTLDYPPNVDAARHFARAIWPAVRARVEGARFVIAGRRPSRKLLALGQAPGIEVSADVPDMSALLRRCWVAIAPMRDGTGVKNKVLEAWAVGRPVVLSPLAANGIELDSTMESLVARTRSEFAAKVVDLLTDHALRHRSGEAARMLAETRHSWRRSGEEMSNLLRAVAAAQRSA